jgi:hypothetical protein
MSLSLDNLTKAISKYLGLQAAPTIARCTMVCKLPMR